MKKSPWKIIKKLLLIIIIIIFTFIIVKILFFSVYKLEELPTQENTIVIPK